MTRYSIEPRTGKYVRGMDFYHLLESIKKIFEYRTRCTKNCFQKSSPQGS